MFSWRCFQITFIKLPGSLALGRCNSSFKQWPLSVHSQPWNVVTLCKARSRLQLSATEPVIDNWHVTASAPQVDVQITDFFDKNYQTRLMERGNFREKRMRPFDQLQTFGSFSKLIAESNNTLYSAKLFLTVTIVGWYANLSNVSRGKLIIFHPSSWKRVRYHVQTVKRGSEDDGVLRPNHTMYAKEGLNEHLTGVHQVKFHR